MLYAGATTPMSDSPNSRGGFFQHVEVRFRLHLAVRSTQLMG